MRSKLGTDDPKVSVIIPYYQRQGGLLRRAIGSVFAQKGVNNYQVIVIDDASPHPARDELAELPEPDRARTTIIEQTNAGPAVARNRGLDALSEETAYVAFLDSDDSWTEDHLLNASTAFNHGADFYVSDCLHEGEEESVLSKVDKLESKTAPLSPQRNIWRFEGDVTLFVVQGPIRTSSVVYDFRKFQSLRFPTDLRRFGEDQYLWLSIISVANCLAVSKNCEVHYGKGVSIYSDQEFGTVKSLLRLADEVSFRKKAVRVFALSDQAQRHVLTRLHGARLRLATEIVHHVVRGRLIQPLKQICNDPALMRAVPKVVGRSLARRLAQGP